MSAFAEPPISRLDADGHLLTCNQAFRDMTGGDDRTLPGSAFNAGLDPAMPASIVATLWHTVRQGRPWVGPVVGRTAGRAPYWRLLYLVPLLSDGRLSALGTAYFELPDDDLQRARHLYRRLAAGQAPWSWPDRLGALAREHAVALTAGAAVLAALGSDLISPLAGAVLVLGLAGQACYSHGYSRLGQRRVLDGCHELFHDPQLAPLYQLRPGPQGGLAMALASQQWRLRTVITRICISSEQLLDRAHTSAEVVQATAHALHEQQQHTHMAATAIEQMSTTIGELSGNLQASAHAASDARELAITAQALSVRSETSMDQLGQSVAGMRLSATELASAVQAIGNIADAIQSIAQQTNLLALNAAIEAARAGESGRGFAVVADEVRTLASRTATSTEEIQRTLHNLRNDSQRSLAIATCGEQAARQAHADVRQTRDALQNICTQVRHISDNSQQMAAALEQQGQVAAQITRQISRIAQRTEAERGRAAQSEEIARALHELADSQLGLSKRFIKG